MTTHDIPNLRTLEKFITSERDKLLTLMVKRYNVPLNDAEDIYQDASVALFQNINSGRLTQLTATLATYFTSICFNLTKNYLNRGKKRQPARLDEWSETKQFDSQKVDELLGLTTEADEDAEEQIQMMRNVVCDLGEPCERILWSFYADEMNMADIALLLDYKNADTVKAKKSQCMSRLRQRFTN